jgi:hypothetical protein
MSLRINAIAFDFYLIGSAVYQVCEIPDWVPDTNWLFLIGLGTF